MAMHLRLENSTLDPWQMLICQYYASAMQTLGQMERDIHAWLRDYKMFSRSVGEQWYNRELSFEEATDLLIKYTADKLITQYVIEFGKKEYGRRVDLHHQNIDMRECFFYSLSLRALITECDNAIEKEEKYIRGREHFLSQLGWSYLQSDWPAREHIFTEWKRESKKLEKFKAQSQETIDFYRARRKRHFKENFAISCILSFLCEDDENVQYKENHFIAWAVLMLCKIYQENKDESTQPF